VFDFVADERNSYDPQGTQGSRCLGKPQAHIREKFDEAVATTH
jgi:hypothetical protein